MFNTASNSCSGYRGFQSSNALSPTLSKAHMLHEPCWSPDMQVPSLARSHDSRSCACGWPCNCSCPVFWRWSLEEDPITPQGLSHLQWTAPEGWQGQSFHKLLAGLTLLLAVLLLSLLWHTSIRLDRYMLASWAQIHEKPIKLCMLWCDYACVIPIGDVSLHQSSFVMAALAQGSG